MARVATNPAAPFLITRRATRSDEWDLVDRLHQCVTDLTASLQSERQVIESLEESNRMMRLQLDVMQRELALDEQRAQLMRDDLIAELLVGDHGPVERVLRRADRLGIDLHSARSVIVVSPDDLTDAERHLSDENRIELVDKLRSTIEHVCECEAAESVFSIERNELIVLASASTCLSVELREARMRNFADDLRTSMRNAVEGMTVSVGIGSICETLPDYARSYQGARWALEGSRARGDRDVTVAANQHGVHALIFDLQDHDRLVSIVEDTIGALLEYDRCHATDFTHTLDLYLRHDCCLQPTAAAAHLHISSLRYRLRRIEEITGVNLHCAETKFNLQFALKMLHVLSRDRQRRAVLLR